ncbi:MAG: hypothetical protein WCR23_11765 [Planctomycetota bacterium]|nr:hypothetical protein [Planctomycetia bacterium]
MATWSGSGVWQERRGVHMSNDQSTSQKAVWHPVAMDRRAEIDWPMSVAGPVEINRHLQPRRVRVE